MKTKIIISICLLLTGLSLRAVDKPTQGLWTTQKITIEKNVDGNIRTAEFDSVDEVLSHIPCPQEWEIYEKKITLKYSDGRKETGKYVVEGNNLKIMSVLAVKSYRYEIKGDTLILITAYDYINNMPGGSSERIKENRTIVLKKQK